MIASIHVTGPIYKFDSANQRLKQCEFSVFTDWQMDDESEEPFSFFLRKEGYFLDAVRGGTETGFYVSLYSFNPFNASDKNLPEFVLEIEGVGGSLIGIFLADDAIELAAIMDKISSLVNFFTKPMDSGSNCL